MEGLRHVALAAAWWRTLDRDECNVFLTCNWHFMKRVKNRKEIQTHLRELKSSWSLFVRRYLKWQLHLIRCIAVKSVWDVRSALVSGINFHGWSFIYYDSNNVRSFLAGDCVFMFSFRSKSSWKALVKRNSLLPVFMELRKLPSCSARPRIRLNKSDPTSFYPPLKSFHLFFGVLLKFEWKCMRKCTLEIILCRWETLKRLFPSSSFVSDRVCVVWGNAFGNSPFLDRIFIYIHALM